MVLFNDLMLLFYSCRMLSDWASMHVVDEINEQVVYNFVYYVLVIHPLLRRLQFYEWEAAFYWLEKPI